MYKMVTGVYNDERILTKAKCVKREAKKDASGKEYELRCYTSHVPFSLHLYKINFEEGTATYVSSLEGKKG